MPGGDGRGPLGNGPMTGRGMGYCVSDSVGAGRGMRPRRGMGMRAGMGRGMRAGMGIRRGWGMNYANAPIQNGYVSEQEELAFLENDARDIKSELTRIEERIHELKKEK